MAQSMTLASGGARALRQLQVASRTLELLASAGRRALPIKGAAIVEAFCDDLAEREMEDVDLLAIDDFAATLEVLTSAGFSVVERGDHAWALRDPWWGASVELHREAATAGLFPLDREGLWARSRTTHGIVGRIPSAADLLVLAAIHATFQHALVLRLDQWTDFRRLVERGDVASRGPAEGGGIDPAVLVEVAGRARAEAAVAAALLVAGAVTGWPPPEALLQLSPLPRGLARWLRPRLATPALFQPPNLPPTARVRWALLKGRRMELVRRTLLPPTAGEHGALGRLRVALRRLAWLVRLSR